MGKGIWLITLVLAVLLLPAACLAEKQEMKYVDLETLKGMLGDPQLLLLDVRSPGDWAKSDKKIQGAVRQEPDQVAAWGATLPKDKKIVLYCAWRNEYTSSRVGQELMKMGFSQVMALKGGWKAWEKAGYPTEPKTKK